MARTKAEVRAFLDAQVGTIPQHPAPYNTGANNLSGQCVTGIKVLLDFLGVPNPYAARGNAIDCGDTLLRQGIAQNGKGWLTIVVNRDMGYIGGVHYGHIWIDLQGEANYESNGAWALHTTKNTRPFSQGQQFINLDNYITEGNVEEMITKDDVGLLRIGHSEIGGWDFNKTHTGEYDQLFLSAWQGKPVKDFIWAQWNNGGGYRAAKEAQRVAVINLQAALDGSKAEAAAARKAVDDANIKVAEETKKATEAGLKANALEAKIKADQDAGDSFLRRLGQFISKYLPGAKS